MRAFLAVMSAFGLLLIAIFGQLTMGQLSTELVYPFPAEAGWIVAAGVCGGYLIWYGLSALFGRPTVSLFVSYVVVLLIMNTAFDVAIGFFEIGSAISLLVHVGVSCFEDQTSSPTDSAEA